MNALEKAEWEKISKTGKRRFVFLRIWPNALVVVGGTLTLSFWFPNSGGWSNIVGCYGILCLILAVFSIVFVEKGVANLTCLFALLFLLPMESGVLSNNSFILGMSVAVIFVIQLFLPVIFWEFFWEHKQKEFQSDTTSLSLNLWEKTRVVGKEKYVWDRYWKIGLPIAICLIIVRMVYERYSTHPDFFRLIIDVCALIILPQTFLRSLWTRRERRYRRLVLGENLTGLKPVLL